MTLRRIAVAVLRHLAALVLCVIVVAAAIGWLYALRNVRALAVGPRPIEGLALQRLAGNDAQPVLRLVVAWLPAGVLAGAALGALRVRGRAVWIGVATFVGLVAMGAGADAVSESQRLAPHLAPQLGRSAIWISTLSAVAGAAMTCLVPAAYHSVSARTTGRSGMTDEWTSSAVSTPPASASTCSTTPSTSAGARVG